MSRRCYSGRAPQGSPARCVAEVMSIGRWVVAAALATSAALGTGVDGARAQEWPVGVDMGCYAPAGDPEPGSPEWIARDTKNQECASLRNRDQLASPAF